MTDDILHEDEGDCKGRRSQKDQKIVSRIVFILPEKKNIMQKRNFFSKKYDIFNVDRG